MNIDRIVLVVAALMVLSGVLLAVVVHQGWLALPALVALNMLQAAFTGFCPLALVLRRAGFRPGPAFG